MMRLRPAVPVGESKRTLTPRNGMIKTIIMIKTIVKYGFAVLPRTGAGVRLCLSGREASASSRQANG